MSTQTRSEEKSGSFALSTDTQVSIERYTAAKVELESHGSATRAQLENVRSYAVEALQGILRDNPGLFDFSARMAAVAVTKREALHRG
jgi:hypothetical protein